MNEWNGFISSTLPTNLPSLEKDQMDGEKFVWILGKNGSGFLEDIKQKIYYVTIFAQRVRFIMKSLMRFPPIIKPFVLS